jgi:hypothetical protein
VFAYCARQERRVTTGSIVVAAMFGGMYETLPDVLYWWRFQPPLVVQWIWILLMPVAAALLTIRQMVQGPTDRVPVARTARRRCLP